MPKASLLNLSPFCHREPLVPKGQNWGSCAQALFLCFACSRTSSHVGNRITRLGFGFPLLLFLLIQGFAFPSFLPQPIINGYRNKSTFSVNRGPDGNPKTVGLYVGTGRGQCRTRNSWKTAGMGCGDGERTLHSLSCQMLQWFMCPEPQQLNSCSSPSRKKYCLCESQPCGEHTLKTQTSSPGE